MGVGWAGVGAGWCWPDLGAGAGQLGAGGAVGCGAWILAWNWAGISSHTFTENSKVMKMQFKFEIHTISIYPALEGLGFRV